MNSDFLKEFLENLVYRYFNNEDLNILIKEAKEVLSKVEIK